MKTQLKVVALSVLVATSTYAQENKDMYFSLGAVQTKFGSTDVSSRTKDGIARNAVTEAYKKNNYKVTFGKRLNKNFAVEGSYTNYSSDAAGTVSMSAASGDALEAAMGALVDTAGFKSQLGLTGVKLSGGATKAKITSSATMSGRSIGLSGLYYFAPSDSFEPFVKLGVSAWNAQAKFSAFQYDNAGVLTTIAGATDFSKDKVSDTNVMYGVGVDGKINDTIKYRVAFERIRADDDNIDNIGISMLYSF
ncbi:hypothetical protein BSPLISOX_2744 [uncultured Gammaproteobacteria bacterium]|nr:hypothetical protein BSPLISOX_2744 [uncultured Gammaproteobacteria bacterium]